MVRLKTQDQLLMGAAVRLFLSVSDKHPNADFLLLKREFWRTMQCYHR